MYRMVYVVVILGVIFLGAACEEDGITGIEYNEVIDLSPPVLEEVEVLSERSIQFCFDESVTVLDNSIDVGEELGFERYDTVACGFVIYVRQRMMPGAQYVISAVVADDNHNSLDIITNVYGHNGSIPDVVINEFTTQGSGKHPDVVELFVRSAGNIGGITLYEGSRNDWESRKVLPSVDISANSYLLIHFKPQGIEDEVDEDVSPNVSGGLDAHESAWDFWVEDGDGLSGNNGVLTLVSSPNGEIMDAIIYSNRSSSSDTKYRGFGSTAHLVRAEELHNAMHWSAEEDLIRPEDVIAIEDTTATRSASRSSTAADTNSKEDWHIVPTSQYSFGEVNSDEVYQPK